MPNFKCITFVSVTYVAIISFVDFFLGRKMAISVGVSYVKINIFTLSLMVMI